MKTYYWITPIVFSACLVLPGCKDSNSPNGRVPVSERPAGEAKLSDSDLEKAVRAKLESDDQIRQANLSVDAEANDNKVSIKGTVASQDIRTKAIELAKSAQPGLTINDEIEVRPAG
jgi:hypothetical protein